MANNKYDYLIVGAGLFGATFAHLATKFGKRCLVIDKRPHTGGNIYCENIQGINVHKYGAHIFHTSDKRIWDFVNNIVPFNRYTNSPIAKAPNGKLYNLPFNMNTFYQLWGVTTPEEAEAKLNEQREDALLSMKKDGVTEPRNLEEQALTLIGKDIYELLIKGYTEKQWGRPCDELPAFIIRRLPVRMSYDNNYFNDSYQGIPIGGYNKLTDGLLEGSDVRLNCDFFNLDCDWHDIADKLVFTGKIDEFFGYKFGTLSYRTVKFETECLQIANLQGNAVVNYTSADVPYTRVIEHKHFESFGQSIYDNPTTVISKEYSTEWVDGMEPFYPVNDALNMEIYNKYSILAEQESNVIFGGRLAEYKYYDMAPLIACAMSIAKEEGL
jgi:UDP-galactopyranose mutase